MGLINSMSIDDLCCLIVISMVLVMIWSAIITVQISILLDSVPRMLLHDIRELKDTKTEQLSETNNLDSNNHCGEDSEKESV